MSSDTSEFLVDVARDRAPLVNRNFGALVSLETPKPNDHACLIYDDREEFISTAVAFLRAGLGLNSDSSTSATASCQHSQRSCQRSAMSKRS